MCGLLKEYETKKKIMINTFRNILVIPSSSSATIRIRKEGYNCIKDEDRHTFFFTLLHR